MIRLWSDFQARTDDGYSILWLDDRRLDDALADELGLAPGDRVILFYEEPGDCFQTEAVLLKSESWGWLAAPDDTTFVRYERGQPPADS